MVEVKDKTTPEVKATPPINREKERARPPVDVLPQTERASSDPALVAPGNCKVESRYATLISYDLSFDTDRQDAETHPPYEIANPDIRCEPL